MQERELIARIERRAYRAWPAAEVYLCDGWRLRYTHGVTHRANSVWPNEVHGYLSLEQKLRVVETFYRERARPAIFHMCSAAEPGQLDAALHLRGYTRGRDTDVQIASITHVLARAGAGEVPVTVGAECDDRWLTAYRRMEHIDSTSALRRGDIMRSIEPAATYAIAWNGAAPCAVGSAVADDGWVGVFNMTTATHYRRQGAGRSVVRALLDWARHEGATNVYLQVMQDNAPALALYHRLGFRTLYSYHYRTHAANSR